MKPSELFKCTNWEFNLAFSSERKTATKSHPCSPCIQDTSPAALLTTWSQKEYAFNVDRVWKVQRVYRLTPRPAPPSQARVTQGLPPLSVSAASLPAACSWRFHATFLIKLNIFLNLRCGWGNSFRCVSTFSGWESGRKAKKKDLNKQI